MNVVTKLRYYLANEREMCPATGQILKLRFLAQDNYTVFILATACLQAFWMQSKYIIYEF